MNQVASIAFPPLDPVLVRIGPLAVHWYGVAYIAGFVMASVLLNAMVRYRTLRLRQSEVSDLLGWLVVGVLVGGRVGWWLFYHDELRPDPWYEVVAVWRGGMSFHGGLVGVVLSLLVWSRWHGVAALHLADALAQVVPAGLFLGRIANFVNAELIGRPTTIWWGVIFPGDTVARHPSQLYEAFLEGLVLFVILRLLATRCSTREGQLTALFLILYGTFRFAVEFTREPDPQIGFIAFGWLTMGQALSIGMVLAGMVLQWIISEPGSNRIPDPRMSG